MSESTAETMAAAAIAAGVTGGDDAPHIAGTSITAEQVAALQAAGHDVALPNRDGKGSSRIMAARHAAILRENGADTNTRARSWSLSDHVTATMAAGGIDYRDRRAGQAETALRNAAHADPHGVPGEIARRVIAERPDVFGAGPDRWERPSLRYW